VLKIVKDEIKSEEVKVEANHVADMATIDGERSTAEAAADKKHADKVAALAKRVSDTEEAFRVTTEAKTAATVAQGVAQSASDIADDEHASAVTHEASEKAAGHAQYSADEAAAESYKANVDTAAADENTEDVRILDAELKALVEIRAALAAIQFSALLEIGQGMGDTGPDCKISYTMKANFAYPKLIFQARSPEGNFQSLAPAQAKCTTLPNCVGVTKDGHGYNLRDVSDKGHYWKGVNSWQRVESCPAPAAPAATTAVHTYDESRTGYNGAMTGTNTDLKTRVLQLVGTIEQQVNNEKERLATEHTDDTVNNENEHARADADAKANHDSDLALLA
jgi:hypothetical protein